MKDKVSEFVKDIMVAQRGMKTKMILNIAWYAALGWIYYRSWWACLIGVGISFLTVKSVYIKMQAQKKKRMYVQFRELMQSLSSSISTGNSFEKAIKRAPEEISFIWSDGKGVLVRALNTMCSKLEINYDVIQALDEFCEEVDLEEARQFSETYKICRQMGGNLLQAIQSCVVIISDKLLTLQEIDHVLSQRKMEQKVLLLMPHLFMLFLSFTSKGFVEPLFTTFVGRIGVSVALLFIVSATIVANKLLDIEV